MKDKTIMGKMVSTNLIMYSLVSGVDNARFGKYHVWTQGSLSHLNLDMYDNDEGYTKEYTLLTYNHHTETFDPDPYRMVPELVLEHSDSAQAVRTNMYVWEEVANSFDNVYCNIHDNVEELFF